MHDHVYKLCLSSQPRVPRTLLPCRFPYFDECCFTVHSIAILLHGSLLLHMTGKLSIRMFSALPSMITYMFNVLGVPSASTLVP